jgi:hypothetical protein
VVFANVAHCHGERNHQELETIGTSQAAMQELEGKDQSWPCATARCGASASPVSFVPVETK